MTASIAEQRLEGAPAELLEPAIRPALAEAQKWCRTLAESHYENFHVATVFLPKAIRPHFYSVYGFCRVSDDLGDEVADTAVATRLLRTWRQMLNECYVTPALSRHPVFVALRPTIDACQLPKQPFDDLITAFEQDQVKTRFATLAEDIEYSKYSANPVGSLVLYICGYRDAALHTLSDKTCTALQLANFWQDVGEDLRERDRIYLPQDRMASFGVTEEVLRKGRETEGYRSMLRELCAETRSMLLEGAPLIDCVDHELAATLRLFTQGGLAILDAIAAIGYNTLSQRPEVSKSAKLHLLASAGLSKIGIHRGSRGLH